MERGAAALVANVKRPPRIRLRRAVGVAQEVWALQDLPDGSKLFILCLGGDDPVGANRLFAESQQAYDRWFKDKAGPILNANFDQPLPPISHTLIDWTG